MNEPMRKPREGFVYKAPELGNVAPPPNDRPPDPRPPHEPLPSEVTPRPPEPEPPLSELEQLRKDIAETAEEWPITVQLLYRSIKNDKGELVSSLTFREPRATEINRIGNPLRMLWDGEVIYEEKKMTYIMASLCGLLPPLLDQMDPRDWNSCALRLRKFFLPDLRAW